MTLQARVGQGDVGRYGVEDWYLRIEDEDVVVIIYS